MDALRYVSQQGIHFDFRSKGYHPRSARARVGLTSALTAYPQTAKDGWFLDLAGLATYAAAERNDQAMLSAYLMPRVTHEGQDVIFHNFAARDPIANSNAYLQPLDRSPTIDEVIGAFDRILSTKTVPCFLTHHEIELV